MSTLPKSPPSRRSSDQHLIDPSKGQGSRQTPNIGGLVHEFLQGQRLLAINSDASTHSADPGDFTMNSTSPGTPDPSPDHISMRQPSIQNLPQAVEEQNGMPADSAIPDDNAKSIRPIVRWLGESKPTEWLSSLAGWLTSLAAICAVWGAYSSGIINVTRERLALEQIGMKQERDTLSERIAALQTELSDVKSRLRPLETERGGIKRIMKMGSEIMFAPDFNGYSIHFREPGYLRRIDGKLKPADVPYFGEFIGAVRDVERVVDLKIGGFQINDSHIQAINSLKLLDVLVLSEVGATDQLLSRLGHHSDLSLLSLSCNYLNKPPVLTGFRTIRYLSLKDNPISDEGLSYIGARAPSVNALDLSGTEVTDEGIHHLLTLPNLSHVSLYKTKVTVRGLVPLMKHPNGKNGAFMVEIEKEKQSKEALEPFIKDGHFFRVVVVDQHEPLPDLSPGPPIE
jgi:hypothetical protein